MPNLKLNLEKHPPSSSGAQPTGDGERPSAVLREARGSWAQWLSLVLGQVLLFGLVSGVSGLIGGPPFFQASMWAGGLILVAISVSYLLLLRPAHPLEFVNTVYLMTMIRMGITLFGVIFVRQIAPPLFWQKWVGYILAFYLLGLFAEIFLVARLQAHPKNVAAKSLPK